MADPADEQVRKPLAERGIQTVIPSRRNRFSPYLYDKDLYKARHLIANFFTKLKQFRCIATRYDKRALHFLSRIFLASSAILLYYLSEIEKILSILWAGLQPVDSSINP